MRKILVVLFVIIPFSCFAQKSLVSPVKISEGMKMVKADSLIKMNNDHQEPRTEEFWINCRCGDTTPMPLIVVDGEIMGNDFNMSNINIEDIESFRILRDEAAFKEYGKAGENGAIVVTTKSKTYTKDAREEYEVTVLDPGYESFLATQQPKDFYTEPTLKMKNSLMTTEWNIRHRSPKSYDPNIYEVSIDYDWTENYGLEFEYRLYMFFRFMEKEHNMSLLNTTALSSIK